VAGMSLIELAIAFVVNHPADTSHGKEVLKLTLRRR
jgi:hypothetical protein